GPEPYVEVVERAERANEVEAALTQGAPKSLHFSSGGRVVGLRVNERRPHACAGQTQRLTAVGRAVVEVQGVGRPVFAHRAHHQPEHVDFALGVMGSEREDVAAGIIENAVDTHRLALAIDQDRRSVTHVGVPKGAGPLRLPAKAYLPAAIVSASK